MNHVLYQMCATQSRHRDPSVVVGKVGLIGRAYSAAPSRGVTIENFYQRLADAIVSRGNELDRAIDEARSLNRISFDTIPVVTEAHGLLNEIVIGFIRDNLEDGAKRGIGHRDSFCSKYLHFHAPRAFPIYDSVVVRELRKRRDNAQYSAPTRGRGPSGAYAGFCRHLIAYADQHHKAEEWTPRSVDGELWSYDVIDTRMRSPEF